MRKYLYIFKSELMSGLQYFSDNIIGFIGYFIMFFVLLNLWQYIYSDPNELINGYDINQMIWYITITEIAWTTSNSRKYCKKICNDVKGGNIAYNINKPYSYIGYCLFSHLGECITKFIFYYILGFLCTYLFIGYIPDISIATLLIVFSSGILALIINTLLITMIGLLSFFLEDSNPLFWLYSKVVLMFGVLFPIEFFPKVMQKILYYSPSYVIASGPAKLFVNFNILDCLYLLLFQVIYIIISYLLCVLVYKKGVKNLNVNGG